MSLLTCQHCHQCAFCEPHFDVCWTGGTGGHLPRSKWDALLDNRIAHPDVLNFLKGEGYKVGQKRKLRMGYCKHYCRSNHSSTPLPTEVPAPKRQCTVLPVGVYIEKTATDFWTPQDHTRLQTFNQLWSFPACLKSTEPITMEQAQHKSNAYPRNQMHWYCEQVLYILSPGQGKVLYSYICNIEIQYANQTTQTALNCILDSLVELYLFGSDWQYQRLAFVQLCGVLSITELNSRLHNRTNARQANRPQRGPQIIKRIKYLTGGKLHPT